MPARPHLPLLDGIDATDAWGVMLPPEKSPEGLQTWHRAQAPNHGSAPWFARMTSAIRAGDWDRAWKTAVCARLFSLMRAYIRARTPEERAAIEALVRGESAVTPEER